MTSGVVKPRITVYIGWEIPVTGVLTYDPNKVDKNKRQENYKMIDKYYYPFSVRMKLTIDNWHNMGNSPCSLPAIYEVQNFVHKVNEEIIMCICIYYLFLSCTASNLSWPCLTLWGTSKKLPTNFFGRLLAKTHVPKHFAQWKNRANLLGRE